MRYLLFLLISLNCIAQQKTVVKVPPSKDTTLVTFTTTTTTTTNTSTAWSASYIPVGSLPIDSTIWPTQPGKYEGFGSQAVGGSQIVYVSNKSQFDAAISNPNGKIITFNASVTFSGRYEFTNKSYFTIDGGGFDVTIDNNNAGDGISIGQGSHHVVITRMRVIDAGNDCINVVDDAHDVLIDHCSAYGGRDGNIDIAAVGGKNITVQYCFIGGIQPGGSGSTLVTSQNVSIHHNLYAPSSVDVNSGMTLGNVQERCPYIHANYSPPGSPNCDFRNNLIYKWGRYASGIGYKATGNFVNNYYASNKSGAIDPGADPSGKDRKSVV